MGRRPYRKRGQALPPEFMLSREYLKPQTYTEKGPLKEQASGTVPGAPEPL